MMTSDAFFKMIEYKPINASAQLVYLHLLNINNTHNNTGSFQVSDSKLAEMTRLSRPSITDAKRDLKNFGLIDFVTDKKSPRRGTWYKLPIQGAVADTSKPQNQRVIADATKPKKFPSPKKDIFNKDINYLKHLKSIKENCNELH